MSTHAFPLTDGRRLADIVFACHDAGRAPASVEYDGAVLTLTFEPDLTPGEVTALTEAVRASVSMLTRAERNALEDDIAGLRTYHGLATPTAAQTALATKAIIRLLRAMLRD